MRINRSHTHGRKAGTRRLVLEGGLIHAEGVILGLGGDRRGCRVVVWISTIAACVTFVIVSIMKTLLGGLRGEGEGGDLGGKVRGRGGAGHDIDAGDA